MPDPIRKYRLIYGKLGYSYRGMPQEVQWFPDVSALAFEDRAVVERFAMEVLKLPGVVAVWIQETVERTSIDSP